jgi:hypothetical protein
VRLSRKDKDCLVFQLHGREKQLLLHTLKLYPLVPPSHHLLSKNNDAQAAEENQRLLEEALAERRQENRRQVLAMLEEPQRFRETKTGLELTLTPAEIEWLLQVLNDVRVGSWLILGEPEPGDEPEVTEANARYLLALELCGLFESSLLAGLGVGESPDWSDD